MARAGWRCTRSTCSPSPWSSPTRTRRTRTSPASSGSTFSTSRNAMSDRGNDRLGLWNEDGRLLLRRAAHARRRPHSAEGPLDGRPHSAVRRRNAGGRRRSSGSMGFSRRMEWFIENRQDLTANIASLRAPGMEGAPPALHRRSRPAAAHSAASCSTSANSCHRTASGRCRASTRSIRMCCDLDGQRSSRRL